MRLEKPKNMSELREKLKKALIRSDLPNNHVKEAYLLFDKVDALEKEKKGLKNSVALLRDSKVKLQQENQRLIKIEANVKRLIVFYQRQSMDWQEEKAKVEKRIQLDGDQGDNKKDLALADSKISEYNSMVKNLEQALKTK